MMQLKYKSLLFGLASCVAVTQLSAGGHSAEGHSTEGHAKQTLSAEQAYIRAMPPGQQVTAAFLKLVNNSDRACKVTGGSSAIASEVQIHEHQHSDGMMKMRPLPSVNVEAGQSLVFEPGQLHLMLFGIDTPLKPGNKQELTLVTENCGSIRVQAEVRSLFKKRPPNHHGHDHSVHEHGAHAHKMHIGNHTQDSNQ
jgi:copper(I)-binding protein